MVPLSRVFPVGFSADSAESVRFLERWFNALNEAGFAESSRDVVDSPSNRVRRPARTTENLVDRRPVMFGDAARGSDCPDNSGAGVDFHEGTIGDVNGRSPRTDDSR